MAKAILAVFNTVFLFGALFVIDIVKMIYGWGVDAKSWSVIIGCFLVTMFAILISTLVTAALKE